MYRTALSRYRSHFKLLHHLNPNPSPHAFSQTHATSLSPSITFVQCRGKKSKPKRKQASATEIPPVSSINFEKYEESMLKTINSLRNSFTKLNADGATPAILDDVMVDAYGAKTALQNVAQVGVRDGRTLVVSVFDEAVTKDVERCIRGAGLGLNPISEGGGKLRVPIPKVSGSARDAMRETAAKEAEAAKIATRMIRRKAMDEVRGLSDVEKDDVKRLERRVQQMTDSYVDDISSALQNKISAIDSLRGS